MADRRAAVDHEIAARAGALLREVRVLLHHPRIPGQPRLLAVTLQRASHPPAPPRSRTRPGRPPRVALEDALDHHGRHRLDRGATRPPLTSSPSATAHPVPRAVGAHLVRPPHPAPGSPVAKWSVDRRRPLPAPRPAARRTSSGTAVAVDRHQPHAHRAGPGSPRPATGTSPPTPPSASVIEDPPRDATISSPPMAPVSPARRRAQRPRPGAGAPAAGRQFPQWAGLPIKLVEIVGDGQRRLQAGRRPGRAAARLPRRHPPSTRSCAGSTVRCPRCRSPSPWPGRPGRATRGTGPCTGGWTVQRDQAQSDPAGLGRDLGGFVAARTLTQPGRPTRRLPPRRAAGAPRRRDARGRRHAGRHRRLAPPSRLGRAPAGPALTPSRSRSTATCCRRWC